MEGVEAWSVANKSKVGVEAGRLHPTVKVKMSNVKMNLVLFMFRLNGFKVALLAGQNFCADASAIGAGYFLISRVIFLEASHALHLGRYKTEVQLRMFRRRALAEFCPIALKGGLVKFGDFAEGNLKCHDVFRVSFIELANSFIEKSSDDV